MNTIIEKIFLKNKLEKVKSIQKIEIGFTNKVYSINNKFILKVCEDVENEINFEKEVFFYSLFKGKIPVPDITIYDRSKKVYNKHYIIYPMIKGDNLYSKWHLLDDIQRKKVIKQLCSILKVINETSYKKYIQKFKIKTPINWQNSIISKICGHMKQVEKKKLISKDFIQVIKKFVKENNQVLTEQKIALVYWDAHFDNILIKGNKVVGILDFERTELGSIDFVLDIIKRMMEYPKKYMSKEFEKFEKKKDYAKLLTWFEEYYPELFDFADLDKRLTLYAIEQDMKTLLGWPDSKAVRNMLAKDIGWKQAKK